MDHIILVSSMRPHIIPIYVINTLSALKSTEIKYSRFIVRERKWKKVISVESHLFVPYSALICCVRVLHGQSFANGNVDIDSRMCLIVLVHRK